MLTIERVADEVASVSVARRAMQPAPAKPSTLMHHRRRSQGECAVTPVDVQALNGKIYAPVPALPSQCPYEIGGFPASGTHRGGVAAAKFVSSVKECTCASLARAFTAV